MSEDPRKKPVMIESKDGVKSLVSLLWVARRKGKGRFRALYWTLNSLGTSKVLKAIGLARQHPKEIVLWDEMSKGLEGDPRRIKVKSGEIKELFDRLNVVTSAALKVDSHNREALALRQELLRGC